MSSNVENVSTVEDEESDDEDEDDQQTDFNVNEQSFDFKDFVKK